ncbi:TIGR00730 family Rossman fold protein [soil metagenome]
MPRLCVFCGSSAGNRPAFADEARRLGELMAASKIGLVYGGGNVGLMGVLARTVMAGGGEVIGVIPHALEAKELALYETTKLHVVNTMHQRKTLMADLADGFAALPGGFGTCDELFEILTWAQLGIHNKPVAILNVENFFTPLIAWLEHVVANGLLKARNLELLRVTDRPADLIAILNEPPPTAEPKWIEERDR